MDPHSILDRDRGDAPPTAGVQPAETAAEKLPPGWWPGTAAVPEIEAPGGQIPAGEGSRSLAEMAQRDLSATLQLLAERAQYITAATGAAIALRDHGEMVCRASAGTSTPEIGAQLQVNSGLSGESIRTRQTLRCDDATTDARVNRESCEALGIRSVVVMPLLRGDDVIGVFELFSDKANVFEARDITALERMGVMVHTALEHTAELGIASAPNTILQPLAPSADEGFDEEDEPGFARDVGRALASTVETGEAPVETMPTPDLAKPNNAASMGRFEALAAARASSRIAFHKKVASAPASASAATPAVAAEQGTPAPVEAAAQAEKTSPVEEKQVGPIESLPAASDQIIEQPQIRALSAPADEATSEEAVAGLSDARPARLSMRDARLSTNSVQDDANRDASTPRPTPAPVAAKEDVVANAPEHASPVVTVARGAIANLKKCAACGFPVSEGRQLCLDCEKKKIQVPAAASKPAAEDKAPTSQAVEVSSALQETTAETPQFLSSDEEEASWLATHKLMVVAIVLALVVIVVLLMMR